MSKYRLRAAVVGLGKMGLLHASILNTLPNVQLVACCDKSRIILRFFRKAFNRIQLVDDVEKLCDLDLDVVYVTTPIPTHFPIIKTICSKEMAHNIFVEKTLAASFDKAEELCRLSQSLGGVNMVGYMKRFAVTFRKAKELLDQAHMGELSSFSAYAYSSDFAGIVKSSKASVGRGGVLEDLGAHVIDLALWFFGDLQVDSAKLESLNVLGSEDSACFSVRNSDGLEGRFDISWCRKECRMPESGIIIRGTKGIMTVNDDTVKLELDDVESRRWYRHDLNDNVGFLLGAPEYYRENECFIESVLNGRNAEPSFYSASKVDYVIDQIKNKTTRERSRNEDL